MYSRLHPRELLPIQDQVCWLMSSPGLATDKNTLSLALLRVGVSREPKVVFYSEICQNTKEIFSKAEVLTVL